MFARVVHTKQSSVIMFIEVINMCSSNVHQESQEEMDREEVATRPTKSQAQLIVLGQLDRFGNPVSYPRKLGACKFPGSCMPNPS